MDIANTTHTDKRQSTILSEKVAKSYESVAVSLIATLINALILGFVQWPVIEHKIIISWLIAVLAMTIVRGVLTRQYNHATKSDASTALWSQRFLVTNIFASLIWAAASFWLFPADNLAHQTFLAFVIGGMAAGAITSLSYFKRAIYPYLLLTLVPLIAQFFYSDSELSSAMGAMVTLYLILISVAAQRTHKSFSQNISLRIQNREQEHSLSQSEQRYKTLLENATDAFYLHDRNGRFIDVNQQACLSLGYSREELLHLSVDDIELGIDPEIVNAEWSKLEHGENIRLEGTHIRKDKTTFPTEVSLGLIQLGDESLISVLARDITERKDAENTIKASQQRMALHVQHTPLGVIEWDTSFRVLEWNPSAETIFGYSREEALGRHATELIIPADTIQHTDTIWQQLLSSNGGLRSSNENITKDGNTIFCEWYNTPLVDDNRNVIGVTSLVQDITEQKAAHKRLYESEAQLSLLLTSSPVVIYTSLPRGDFPATFISDNIQSLMGYTPEQFTEDASFWAKGIHPDDAPRVFEDLGQLFEHDIHLHDYRFKIHDDSYIWVHDELRLLRDDKGEPSLIVGYWADITSSKTAQNEIIAAKNSAEKASRAKSEFLSNMSHELRTPLNAILGFGQLLEMEIEDPEQNAHISEIIKAGNHLLELINEILDLSKIEAGKFDLSMEECHLNALLNDCITFVTPLADKRDIRIINTINRSGDYTINVDYTRFKQVLLNLLSNAIKYNNDEGTIELSCEITENDTIRINIKDSGNGLTTEQQQHLFKPFERMQEHAAVEGTGIGLVITKRLIELMNGEIGVSSEPGRGSTFWIAVNLSSSSPPTLPVLPVEDTRSIQPADVEQNRKTILYIEDNPTNLKLVTKLIEMQSQHSLISAPDAALGLILAESQLPDLILMDINLPGMDGYEAMIELQNNITTREIPVIAISANAMPSDLKKGATAGFVDYITKPIDVKALLEVIHKTLN